MNRGFWTISVACALAATLSACASPSSVRPSGAAPQITGVLGSPSATTTVGGTQLPSSPPEFGGVIKETLVGSKTWWPPRIVPPKGAPNILLIMSRNPGRREPLVGSVTGTQGPAVIG